MEDSQPCVRTRGQLLKDEQLFDNVAYTYSNQYYHSWSMSWSDQVTEELVLAQQ